jgi:hypothetical protein
MRDRLHSLGIGTRVPFVLVGVLVMLIFMPAVNVVSVLIGGGKELSYDFDVSVSSCRADSPRCVTFVMLQIGNTGAVSQDSIEVDMQKLPVWTSVTHGYVKIVASNDVVVPPAVAIDRANRAISIRNLPENLMLEFGFIWYGREANQALLALKPEIRAEGRVVESNPKATALARAFRTAFAFLI